jgi:hypothetical protein
MPFAILPVISALWGNPWTRLIAVATLAAGFGFYKGFQAVPRVDVAAVTRNAEAGRDAEWTRKLAEQESQAALAIDAALLARDRADPVDGTVELFCKSDAACRDRGEVAKH